jgi:polyphenol oxidase
MQLTHYQVPAWHSHADLIHGFLGRGGGRSRHPYAGLNLSHRVGDDASVVKDNVCDMKKSLGLHDLRIVTMNQCHGDRIIDVNEPKKDAGQGDAMVTSTPGLFLGVLTADCAPILFWSATGGQKLAAVVHAGWRGTLKGLAAKMVAHIEDRYGVEPASLQCALGPTIDACCYEVGADVAGSLMKQWGANAAKSIRTVNDRIHLELKTLNAALLADAGVPGQQISSIGPCTACTPGEFFSHRRETKAQIPRTGRQMSLIGWSADR